jgi:hypothetical protein
MLSGGWLDEVKLWTAKVVIRSRFSDETIAEVHRSSRPRCGRDGAVRGRLRTGVLARPRRASCIGESPSEMSTRCLRSTSRRSKRLVSRDAKCWQTLLTQATPRCCRHFRPSSPGASQTGCSVTRRDSVEQRRCLYCMKPLRNFFVVG